MWPTLTWVTRLCTLFLCYAVCMNIVVSSSSLWVAECKMRNCTSSTSCDTHNNFIMYVVLDMFGRVITVSRTSCYNCITYIMLLI